MEYSYWKTLGHEIKTKQAMNDPLPQDESK